MANKKKLPADTNKKAKSIVDIATGMQQEPVQNELKSAAATLGRAGGLKGGVARDKALSSKRKTEIAKKAAAARWNKN